LARSGPIWTKFGTQAQNNSPMTNEWSKLKPKAKIQYGGRLFSKPEVVLTQPKVDRFRPNLVCRLPLAYINELFHQTQNRKLTCSTIVAIMK